MGPGHEMWKQYLLESPMLEYNILGETMLITDDWDHFDNISLHDVIGAGTHAQIAGSLVPNELDMGKWYRSKEKLEGHYPYGGYLTNKKWHLNEVISFKQCLINHPNYGRKWQTI